MRKRHFRISLVLTALVLLLGAAPAAAEDFQLFILGQITGQEPVKGGTLYTADVFGEGVPFGEVSGISTFILRGPLIQEGGVVLVDADGDELYLAGEGEFSTSTAFSGSGSIAGGTGKYAKATGSFDFLGEDLGGGQYYVYYEGTIEL